MVLIESISGVSINLLSNVIQNKLDDLKSDYDWKKLFVDAGNTVLIDDVQKELYDVLSEKNLKEIAKKMKKKSGHEFRQELTNELLHLMDEYEIDSRMAQSFINHFCNLIIEGLEAVDDTKSISVFISEFRGEMIPVVNKIDKNIGKLLSIIDEKIYRIDDIDKRIHDNSLYHELGLDFF